MKKYKKTLIIAVISLMIMGIVPFTTTADTITKTQADTFVATGEMYWGMNREQVKAWTREMGKTPFYPSWDADWCAWFVTNAARTSEISSYVIPNLTNCDRTWYMNRGQYHTGRGWGSNYTPKRGDILYFDFDYDNYSDHTGIVRYVKNGRVYTVEGNYLHTVNGSSMSWTNDVIYRSYSLYNDYIRGYSTPRFGPIDNSYTIKYNANGGSGYMAPTKVPRYGTRVPLRSNKFTRPGYVFVGWKLYRKSDQNWYFYQDSKHYGWYQGNTHPNGYPKAVWPNGKICNGKSTYVDNDEIILYAVWEKEKKAENSKIWTRVYGNNRYDTMKSIVNQGFGGTKKGTVILTSGQNYKDAVAASGFAGLYDAPIILTTPKALSKQAESLLKQLKPENVYIIGGNMAVSNQVKLQVEQVTGVKAKRVSGQTSSETSAKMALEGKGLWSSDKTAIIATNASYQDALSASPVAYAKKYPLLLADGGKQLSADVLDALKQLEINKVIIAGGEIAVTPKVVSQLEKANIKVTRLYGKNAVLTSRKIATWGLNRGMTINKLGVATGKNFPDALAGGAFCGHNNSVLLLADDTALNNVSYVKTKKKDISKGFIFGGHTAVGTRTYQQLDAATK